MNFNKVICPSTFFFSLVIYYFEEHVMKKKNGSDLEILNLI